MGPLPCWAGLGTCVAAHGRHGYDNAFHYPPAPAVVIDSLVLQHGRVNKILKEEGFDVVAVVKSESKTVPRKRKPKTESLEGKKAKK